MAEEHIADFAELLRRARRFAGLSQEELAERAGLSARAISALERGVNRAPRPDTLDMLADALALPPEDRRRWQQLRQQQARRADTTPAAAHRAHPPNNLPPQPTRFFGRESEIADLTRMVRDAGTRLVTLTGPGGTGKTRLALQVAASLLEVYPDGVFFVDLAPVSDSDLVLPTIGARLGIRPPGDRPIVATLAERLHSKRLLLLVDNFEQVLDAAPEIGELVGRCPDMHVMATSRAPLRLRGEREFPVLPLPVIEVVAIADAAGSDAVRLFNDRARAVRPDFDGEPALVARICRRLDGLPLAIELAAASVRLFPPKTILARLEEHLPLVTASHRDAPARQRTLHDTIAWSNDLLTPTERALFRRLSIFKGGWTLEAAEAVAGSDTGAAAIDVLLGTETLIEHSLIQTHEWLDGSPRFTMLETVREFGLDQLAMYGELDETHHLHATYLLRLNAGSVEQLRGRGFQRWLQRGDVEIENARLALDWATTHDPALALRLVREVGWYLLTRGAFVEAWHWLERALANANDVPDNLRAGALLDMAMHATTFGDLEAARGSVEDALAIYQQLDDLSGIAECVHAFGRIAMWSNDFERAVPLFEEAIVLFRRLDASTLTVAYANLAAVLIEIHEFDRAASVLDEGLAYGERRGDAWATVLLVGSIGELERSRGHLADARQAARRALLALRDLLDPRYTAQHLVLCAYLAIDEGALDHAARLLGAASSLRETIGFSIHPDEDREYVRLIPQARERAGAERWAQAWESGRVLSQSEAIDLALGGLM